MNRHAKCASLSCASLISVLCEFENQKGAAMSLFTCYRSFFSPFLCYSCEPNQIFAFHDYTRSSRFLAPASRKSSLLQLAGMQPFPKSTLQTLPSPSHPDGIGRAVGVLWDRRKLCEHSCRAILVCLLAQWLHACLLGSLFASDEEDERDEGSRVQALWSRRGLFEDLGTSNALICC